MAARELVELLGGAVAPTGAGCGSSCVVATDGTLTPAASLFRRTGTTGDRTMLTRRLMAAPAIACTLLTATPAASQSGAALVGMVRRIAPEVRAAVVARWGDEVAPDGNVDRRAVFAEDAQLQRGRGGRILPKNRRAPLWRNDRVIGIFEHKNAVADTDPQGPAASAFLPT